MIPLTKSGVTLLDLFAPTVALFNLCVVITSVTLFYRRLKRDHDWNRRQATQHMLLELVTGRFSEVRRQLAVEFGVDVTKSNEDYSSKIATLDEQQRKSLTHITKTILNYFEIIAIGMRNHVLYEDICYDSMSMMFVQHRRWAKSLVDDVRAQHPTLWIEFNYYANQWEKRLEDEVQNMLPPKKLPT